MGGLKSGWNEAEPKAGVHWIIPLLDARRGQVYTALFGADSESQESAPIRLEADGIRLMQSWVEAIRNASASCLKRNARSAFGLLGKWNSMPKPPAGLSRGSENGAYSSVLARRPLDGVLGRSEGCSPVKRMMCIRWYPIIHSFPKRKRTCCVSGEGRRIRHGSAEEAGRW